MLESAGKLELSGVRGKREVYLFQVVENPMEGVKSALVIAGSDKRGTIYGLFYLSEKLGVSPLVNWNHVLPKRREYVILTEKDSFVSKEPSVKYRGFLLTMSGRHLALGQTSILAELMQRVMSVCLNCFFD